jgi:glycosyltransferase involved in cell wall biosynthesis
MPRAIKRFDLRGFDLIISSSHCAAKGVRVPEGIPHLCYCHTPMRYAWHLSDLYLQRVPAWLRPIAQKQFQKLREWDRLTAAGVTQFIANGQTVQRRIREAYGRESIIIHPPVDTDFYQTHPSRPREDFYLVVSALVPNKRIDLAVLAAKQLNRLLIVIGTGPDEGALRSLAGPQTRFLGSCSDEEIRDHYQRCRALLFPGEEDFGMVPIEANACGAPVIAFGRGGATETILPPEASPDPTGIWFSEPTTESLVQAMQRFESNPALIRPLDCRKQAEHFSKGRFNREMMALLDNYQK